MKKLLSILALYALGIPDALYCASGQDQQTISPVQACANGNITGGSVIICVQSTIVTQSGCIGASCEKQVLLAVGDQATQDTPVQFDIKDVPTVNLGRIVRDTHFTFYMPAPGSQLLYTFTPIAGAAAGKSIEILVAMEKAHRPEYVQANKEEAFDPDAYDLRLYKREQAGWKSIGLITHVLKDLMQPDAQPLPLTLRRDGTIVIPVRDKQPLLFNVAKL